MVQVVSCLDRHSANEDVVGNVISALINLIDKCGSNCDLLCTAANIASILHAWTAHPDSANIAVSGCELISHLSRYGSNPAANNILLEEGGMFLLASSIITFRVEVVDS